MKTNFAKMSLEKMKQLLSDVKDEDNMESVEDRLKKLLALQKELQELEFDLRMESF